MKKILFLVFIHTLSFIAYSMTMAEKIAEDAIRLYKMNDTYNAIKKIKIAYLMDSSSKTVLSYYQIIMSKRKALLKETMMNAEFFYSRGKWEKALQFYKMAFDYEPTNRGIISRMKELSKYLGIQKKVSNSINSRIAAEKDNKSSIVSPDLLQNSNIDISVKYKIALKYFKSKQYFNALKNFLPILMAKKDYKKIIPCSKICISKLIKSINLFSLNPKINLSYTNDEVFLKDLYNVSMIRNDIYKIKSFSMVFFYLSKKNEWFEKLFFQTYDKIKDKNILSTAFYYLGKVYLSKRNYYDSARYFAISNEIDPEAIKYKDFAYSYFINYTSSFIVIFLILVFAGIVFFIDIQMFFLLKNKLISDFEYAISLYKQEKFDKALNILKKLKEKKSKFDVNSLFLYFEGMIFMKKNDLKSALTSFQNCKKEEFFIEPYINIAIIYGILGNIDQSRIEIRMGTQQIAESYIRRKHISEIGILDYKRIFIDDDKSDTFLLFKTVVDLMRYK